MTLIEIVLIVLAGSTLGLIVYDIFRHKAKGRLWSCASLLLSYALLLASGHAVMYFYGRLAVTAYVVGFSVLVFAVHARHTVDDTDDDDDDRVHIMV